MPTVKKSLKMRPALTAAKLEYLQTGETDDPDTYLDWENGRDGGEVRRTFFAIRDDFPPGYFTWAEEEFGKR